MEDRFRVGVVTTVHGLKGEVKVFPTTEDPGRFRDLKRVFWVKGSAERELQVQSVRFFKQLVIVKFQGLDRIEDVEKFPKGELYVAREDAIPLEEGEYYIPDLLGLKVESDEGEDLGILADVLDTGANQVYVVQKEGFPELLIPNIPLCILKVDLEQGIMLVHLLEGLR